MPPLPEDVFRELRAHQSRDAFAAFVADPWRARGYDVERDGDRLRADDRELRWSSVPTVSAHPGMAGS
jgi:hypothetical protein